ncbi:PIN domain-containing protein [Treponema primitia]|uniref:PIN domain-containing protein n=1 Tax=Treponema primitia TaxID=88058 RepID=UPI00025551A3|nr:PIN domain-containing protein [Treponema primitia]
MKVLVDTNVILDVLQCRGEFYESSYRVIQLALQGRFNCFIGAGAVTDIYYIINKNPGNAQKSRDTIIKLSTLVGFCDTAAKDINTALSLGISDFEDAVVAATAYREKADYIVTRNAKDFKNSLVPAVTPEELISIV